MKNPELNTALGTEKKLDAEFKTLMIVCELFEQCTKEEITRIIRYCRSRFGVNA